MLLPRPAIAAPWLSELWLDAQPINPAGTLPRMIEVTEPTITNPLSIVIANATNSSFSFGRIIQIFTLTPPAANVHASRIIHDTPFPLGSDIAQNAALPNNQFYSFNPTYNPFGFTSFDLTGSRSIVLFDTVVSITGFPTLKVHQPAAAVPTPVDVITLGAPTGTRQHPAFLDRPIIDPTGIAVITRPTELGEQTPWPNLYLTGTPDSDLLLAVEAQTYQLNPGLPNIEFDPDASTSATPPPHMPEPTTMLIVILGLVSLPRRKSRL